MKYEKLYVKISEFKSYDEINILFEELLIEYPRTTENNENLFNVIIGPIENENANKILSSFISKGYKKVEIIIK